MKILYAIQGTGNGHLSRANDIVPLLQKKGEVDILVSGTLADVDIPFNIKYRMRGMSFCVGKKGEVDLIKTIKTINVRGFWKEMRSLPVQQYDLIVNDFEPVSAWAALLFKVRSV